MINNNKQPSSSKSVISNNDTGTSISILMSYKSKLGSGTSDGTNITNNCSASVQMSLWAGSISDDSNTNVSDSSTPPSTSSQGTAGKTLTYYHYEDHPRQFNHTDALLQRLYPISVIHIAVLDDNQLSNNNNNNANGKNRVKKGSNNDDDTTTFRNPTSKRLVSFLRDIMIKQKQQQDQDQISHRNRSRHAASGGAELDPVVIHTNTSIFDTIDFPRLTSIVQQLLGDDNSSSNIDSKAASLQFTGNTYLQQHTIVAKCLQLYLYSIDNAYPNVVNSDSGPDSIVGSYKQIGIHGHLNSHLVLDSIACDAIHLWPPATLGQWTVTGGTTNTNSLAGIITSHTCTVMGKRLLYQWLRQPLINLQQIQYRQDAVHELVQRSVGRDAIRSLGLKLFTGPSQDLSRLANNLQKYQVLDKNSDSNDDNDDTNNNSDDQGKESSSLLTSTGSTRKALLTLYNLYLVSSEKIPRLVEQVENSLLAPSTDDNGNDSGKCQSDLLLKDCLQQLQQCANELHGGTELCQAVLDLDVAPSDFFVRRDYKEELHDICIEFDKLKDELDQCHASMNEKWARVNGSTAASLSSSSTIRLESVSNENYGSELKYQFRLPNTNDSKVLTSNFGKSVTIHRILKNGVYFTTSELRQLSVQKAELTAEYDRHQAEIVSQAIVVAATYVSVLYRADAAIALLDALISLAHLASYSRYGYCKPILTDSDEDGAGIELHQSRHPCVELQDNTNTTEYIPNDIKLIFGESSFLLVTGPNMGGKSTYIRSLGAIVTLAQIGSYVPCKYAKINICHHILARVGAGDLQERGISTFMAEMLESSSILRTATRRSLIIIDELGRGTSTFDGYGLARAISEYVVQKIQCLTVFATHFHELTALEDTERCVSNCHVTAQKGKHGLTFLYEVKPGPCLESFGIQVAEMANVPGIVIRDAKRRARELENFEYRSKKKANMITSLDNNIEMTTTTTTTTEENDHETAEEMSAAVALMNQFKRIPLPEFLSNHNNSTDEEKIKSLQQILVGL